jgi:hypothetical protein
LGNSGNVRVNREDRKFKIEFTRNKAKVDEGVVYYNIKLQRLEVTVLPRVLLLCIASVFNIEELEKSIFSAIYYYKDEC